VKQTLEICGATLEADCAGALYWPDESMLAVADLHLEKGSSFAARGILLPPYDTAATLSGLAQLTKRYAPRLVIALGDSFHDPGGPARLAAADRDQIAKLQRGRDWIWIAGNHDPDPAPGIGGTFVPSLAVGALTFRHEPAGDAGEIAGHLHPSARVNWRGQTIVRRCFAANRRCAVMPAFGAYTGGLSIRDRAFSAVFGALDFTAHLMGERRVFSIPAAHCY
jgi:DNA ligase-associated metallophosphoesterase